jgi:hypothetical protein
MYRGHWSFGEAYSIPTTIRKWFLRRLLKQFEIENKALAKD